MGTPTTILFTDVEGSTGMQTALGDVVARTAISAWESLAAPLVAEYGGTVIKALGDGLMITFESPSEAVTCALRLNEATLRSNQQNPERAVRVRAGLHTGEVLLEDGDIHGAAVSAAARICDAAQGGEIVVSEVVRQLAGQMEHARFVNRKTIPMRGFDEDWLVYDVVRSDARDGYATAWPFVGREPQREELRELLTRCAAKQGSVALIGGEAGVGKSRLLSEVRREARQRGMWVSVGHCYNDARGRAYAPFIEAIENAMRVLPDDIFIGLLGDNAWALAPLIPRLREMIPDLPESVDMPADAHREFVTRAVRETLLSTVEQIPHVVVIEDLHWADESTIVVFKDLLDRVEELPAMLVGTYRDSVAERTEGLSDVLADMVRRRNAHLISLDRLSTDEVTELLRSAGGDQPPPEVVAAMHEVSNGNALLVEELYRHLAASGRLLDERGRFVPALSLGLLDVPANARLILDRRVEALTDQSQKLLDVVAIVGRESTFGVLSAVSQMDEDDVLDAIDEARSASVLTEDRSGPTVIYEFNHELLRRAVLTRMSSARRARYHLRAAEAIDERKSDGSDSAVVAAHLQAAGEGVDRARLVDAFVTAGDYAFATTAFESAARNYAEALERMADEDRHDQVDLLVKLGFSYRGVDEWDKAGQCWNRALTLLEEAGDVEGVVDLGYAVTRQLAWEYRFEEMVAVARRGLDALGDTPSQKRPLAMIMLALAMVVVGQEQESVEIVAEAKRLAEDCDDVIRAEVLTMEAVHNYFLMRMPETASIGEASAQALRDAGDLWSLADGLVFVGFSNAHQGDFVAWEKTKAELLPLATRLHHTSAMLAERRIAFAVAAAEDGTEATIGQIAASHREMALATGNQGIIGSAHTLDGVHEFWSGRWPQASEQFDRGVDMAGPFWVLSQRGAQMLFRAHCGEKDFVTEALETLAPHLPTPGEPNQLGEWTLALFAAEAVGIVGDVAWAQRILPMAQDALLTGARLRQVDGRLIRTCVAQAAAAAQQFDLALELFEDSMAEADALGHRIERPYVRLYLASFLNESGLQSRFEIDELLRVAEDEFSTLGMTRHATLAAASAR